jgi:hypothetical protein
VKTAQREIIIKSPNGQEYIVQATCTINFAVHRNVGNPKRLYWVLTHIPTGASITRTLERYFVNTSKKNTLVKVAKFLEESGDDSVLSVDDFNSSDLKSQLLQLIKNIPDNIKM